MKPLTREIEFNPTFREGMIRQVELQMNPHMVGRVVSKRPWDGGILAYFISQTQGDHIEIGCAWGGSAMLAAKAKPCGHVHTLDPFVEFKESEPAPTSPLVARRNFEYFSLNWKITLHVGFHPPLPFMLENHRFATAFIDGNHSYETALKDWMNLKDRVDDFVMFHDLDNVNVMRVFAMAQDDPDWELAYKYPYMGVVRRV